MIIIGKRGTRNWHQAFELYNNNRVARRSCSSESKSPTSWAWKTKETALRSNSQWEGSSRRQKERKEIGSKSVPFRRFFVLFRLFFHSFIIQYYVSYRRLFVLFSILFRSLNILKETKDRKRDFLTLFRSVFQRAEITLSNRIAPNYKPHPKRQNLHVSLWHANSSWFCVRQLCLPIWGRVS